MRRIEKGAEPACLRELRATPGADWSSVYGDQKQAMRVLAYTEQGGLCAYCMSRLSAPDEGSMKIEHFEARSAVPERRFVWENLLGVCLGEVDASGVAARQQRHYCETYRGAATLHVHPARFPPDAGTLFSYTAQGEIRPAPHLGQTEVANVRATIDALNLNIDRLKRNRRDVLEVVRNHLKRRRPTRSEVRRELERAQRIDANGRLSPYNQVVVLYLKKKLRQLG